MYKKTFEIELVVNEGNFTKLSEMYFEISKDGLYENFDEFIEDMINFRLLHHIVDNAQDIRLYMRHCNCQQT